MKLIEYHFNEKGCIPLCEGTADGGIPVMFSNAEDMVELRCILLDIAHSLSILAEESASEGCGGRQGRD